MTHVIVGLVLIGLGLVALFNADRLSTRIDRIRRRPAADHDSADGESR